MKSNNAWGFTPVFWKWDAGVSPEDSDRIWDPKYTRLAPCSAVTNLYECHASPRNSSLARQRYPPLEGCSGKADSRCPPLSPVGFARTREWLLIKASKQASPAYCVAVVIVAPACWASLRRFALCGTTPACHGRWRLAVRWLTQEEIVVTNRRWDARAQRLFRLRCRRRFERLVCCGARIVPDAIEFRDQVDGLLRRSRGRSSALLRPLPSVSTVEGLAGRLLAAVRPFSSICLCRTFSTALLQAL